MDKKSKYFFLAFFIIIAVVVIVTFFKYFVWLDYYIKAEADCDPAEEACFIYECNPEEEEDCPSDPEERISYYKYINKKAYAIPLVDPNSEDFPGLECQEWEEECEEILCSEDTVGEGEECNDPEKYKLENPEEEEVECEGEEECSEVGEEEDDSSEEDGEEGSGEDEEEDVSSEEDSEDEENQGNNTEENNPEDGEESIG